MANLPSILALQVAMALIVGIYYLWPPGSALLSRYARWQASGGAFGTGLVYALAGGVLSEVSFVVFQQHGRWTRANVENVGFNFVVFFIAGSLVYEFYQYQTIWWGSGTSFSVIARKVMVDQFGYTLLFAAPYYAILTRWHTLRFSFARLGNELRHGFLTDRLLPVLVTNWMFWIPAVSFVYAMPPVLQPPLAAFATAIWGLLVTAIGGQDTACEAAPVAAHPPALAGTAK